MPGRLAIVGASVRAAAASAVQAGFSPIAADQFGDDDLRRIAPTTRIADYPHGLVCWLQSLSPRPDAWLYSGALENHPEVVNTMTAAAPLWGNTGRVLRDVRSVARLAEVFDQSGLLFPETIASSEGLPRDGSWLAKTGCGASGSGVRALLKDDSGAMPDVTLAEPVVPRLEEGPVYQRRVAGEPFSGVFVGAGGAATLLGVVRQFVGEDWLGAGEFQYCGAIGLWPLEPTTMAEIARIGSVLADRFGLVGLFGVDLVIDGQQVWGIEVNPRYTASVEVVERATGIEAIAAHATACTERCLPPSPTRAENVCGKAILFAKQQVIISPELVDWAARESQRDRWPSIADLSPAGTIIDASRPVMTCFAEGYANRSVEAALRARVAEIERTIYSQTPV